MAKQHRDFVVYVKNGVEINALVAISQDVTTPATQTEPAVTTEYLTLMYLDPNAASPRPSGDQLRNSMKLDFDVPPLLEGKVFGWKDVVSVDVQQVQPVSDGSGTERWGGSDWTKAGQDASGFPVEKGSPSDVTASNAPAGEGIVGPDGKTDAQRGSTWGSFQHMKAIGGGPLGTANPEFVQNDPEAFKAFNDGRAGKPEDGEGHEYQDVLRENAGHSSGLGVTDKFPAGDGQLMSGKGPNPPLTPDAQPQELDNPAPSSPKDEPLEQGDVVGE